MTIEAAQPGGSKIIKEDYNTTDEKIEVEVTTFDIWLKENKISNVAVCKVDVEGHELEVFEGMKNSLNEGRIGSIVFERCMPFNVDDPVVKLLESNNFRIFRIYKSFRKIKTLAPDNNGKYLRSTSDYVAVLKGSKFEKRLSPFT